MERSSDSIRGRRVRGAATPCQILNLLSTFLHEKACLRLLISFVLFLKTLLTLRRFFDTRALVRFYKCHVWPVLEFPTAAVLHAATSVLELLDRVQKRFLREISLSEEEALLHYNLAPLKCRRDMAALGLLHRTTLGKGPPHFQKWFYLSLETAAYNTRLQESRHNS